MPVVVHQAEMQTLTIELEIGHTVTGQLRTKDGKPVTEAKVSLYHSDGLTKPREAKSDLEGAYSVEGIAPGKVFLDVKAQERANSRRTFAVTTSMKDVDCVPDAQSPQSLLSGVVLDPQGHPLAGAMVQAIVGYTMNYAEATFAQTKLCTVADGRFEIGGLPGGKLDLMASHPDHGRVRDGEKSLIAAQLLEVKPEFGGEASVAGFVRYTDGQPAKGVFVDAYSDTGGSTATTKPDGSFVLTGLKPTKWTLSAQEQQQYNNVGNSSKSSKNVVLAAKETKTGIELVLKRTNKTIEGHVLDADGHPAVGVLVGLMHSQGVRWGCNPAFTSDTKTTANEMGSLPPREDQRRHLRRVRAMGGLA